MKKFLVIMLMTTVLFFTGCEKEVSKEKGNYKEGTYFGSVKYESYGANYVTTAVVYVNDEGLIKSVYVDSTYSKDGVNTTKKTLGDDYAMKATSAAIGTIEGGAEWYEQVAVIENKVISEQVIDWVVWADEEQTKLDGVTGATITANTYIEAIGIALEQAK